MIPMCRVTIAAVFAWCLPSVCLLAAQVAPSAWPRCIAERDGQQLGLAGSVCECSYEAGGTMLSKPPGWRWSCDIMRSDGDQLEIPADTFNDRQSLPPDLTYAPQNGATTQPEPQNLPAGRSYEILPRTPTPLFTGRHRQ